MDAIKELMDGIIMKMTPPPDATFSQSFEAYSKGLEFLKEAMEAEFKKGYAQSEKDQKKKKVDHQIKNN